MPGLNVEARRLAAVESEKAAEGLAVPSVRPLAEICDAAGQATCGECWQVPGVPCAPDGVHVARLARAVRRGLITGAELVSVLGTLPAFTTSTLVRDREPGGAR
jgi:hypothetical protein